MMNWKGFGRRWLWPNFKVLSCIRLEGQKKPRKPSVKIAGPELTFEPETSCILSRSINYLTTTFGVLNAC
jgi:hypothetical protein